MSRRNNVRGPTSALTEFLRESGITPTTIARRARTRQVPQDQPTAGPSNQAQGEQEGGNEDSEMAEAQENGGYASDDLDEPEEDEPPPKKQKISRAAAAKQKAAEKAKAKGKGKKGKKGDEDDDYEDDEDDPYSALSKMWKNDVSKPPVGSFEDCVRCSKQFTVTKYTMAANPPPGWLCHNCAKSSGADPFKKPAAARKRKTASDKRTVVSYEERRFPSLASVCIQVITKHIDDVDALGDIGGMNMDEIAKALANNRSLNAENVMLFYNIENEQLTLYDVTNLTPPALCALASLNPNLTSLRLDFCGRMDDSVAAEWATSLPHLKRIELLGPFLVRAPSWQNFFREHPSLEGFLITQSPRFDLECMNALVKNCNLNLKELRLKEVGKMADNLLECLDPLNTQLTYLDISYPGIGDALSTVAIIDLLGRIGGPLEHLDLSGNLNVTDAVLFQGIKPYARNLSALALADCVDLTDAGVAEFFGTWSAGAVAALDFSRIPELSDAALGALLNHSAASLTRLSINGWKDLSDTALQALPKMADGLRRLDVSWCRAVDDWFVKSLLEQCSELEDLKVWGCGRLTAHCARKRGVNIDGIELSVL
ncbi:RNI-like protein [Epithele typhae]|uniref:RNI-like protein n=1 Tax=Epithele typhae TaxID=378194 RepID=UPI0020074841|nr:RNI-like protein [Epithele typhae]KAH9923728.1 RNI-like protein [Epithele typhae]